MKNFDKLLKIAEINIKFNDTYKIQYLEQGAYNRLCKVLSEMRKLKELQPHEHHTIFQVHKRLYLNYYKIKELNRQNPRKVAQQFIGKKKIRNFILKRDGYKCLKCGNTEKLQIDHIMPVSKGGENKLSNLQTLCNICNSKKRDNYKDYR
jgi:hypothetical protein